MKKFSSFYQPNALITCTIKLQKLVKYSHSNIQIQIHIQIYSQIYIQMKIYYTQSAFPINRVYSTWFILFLIQIIKLFNVISSVNLKSDLIVKLPVFNLNIHCIFFKVLLFSFESIFARFHQQHQFQVYMLSQ